MRHLFVTQDFGPDLGGMARRHVEICRRLAPWVTVSTVSADGELEFDRAEPYPIFRQSFTFQRAKRLVSQAQWARDVMRMAQEHAVIHCGNIRPNGYGVWWASRRTRVPYLLYVNGGDLLRERAKARSPLKRVSARAIFGDAAAVVATSGWVANLTREIMDELGVRAGPPVHELGLGTDPDVFRPGADSGRLRRAWGVGADPVMITAARLVPHKGQDVAMRALSRISARFPRLRYVLVGDGHYEPQLRALATDLGLAAKVVFAGSLTDDLLPEAYATSTLYVGLSRLDRGLDVEGFGISFLEAAASGLAVVAGDSGGVRSAVRDEVTGLVVPPDDDEAAAVAIARLLDDERLRRQLGAAGRRAVEERLNWDRVAGDTRDLAERVVHQTRRR